MSKHEFLVLKCGESGDEEEEGGNMGDGGEKDPNFLEGKYSPRNISMYKRPRNIWIEFSQRIHMDSKM